MTDHLTSEARASAYAEWRGILPDGYMQAPFDAGFDAGRASLSTTLAAAEAEREGMRGALTALASPDALHPQYGALDELLARIAFARRALNSEPSDA